MLLRLKIKAKAKIRLVGATPLRALGTQFREVVGAIVQFVGQRFRDKAAGAKSERSDAGVKRGDRSGCFSFRSTAGRADVMYFRVQTSTPSPFASPPFRTVFAVFVLILFASARSLAINVYFDLPGIPETWEPRYLLESGQRLERLELWNVWNRR
jgi:hypothetical protein